MTIPDHILADVLDHPEDDFPRLVYADWLEDHGEAEHAEFIQKQIRGESAVMSARQFKRWYGDWADERVLFSRTGSSPDIPGNCFEQCVFGSVSASSQIFYDTHHTWGTFTIRRGFIEKAVVPFHVWQKYGKQIVTRQPIEHVLISDKQPYHGHNGLYYWRRNGLDTHYILEPFWNLAVKKEGNRVTGFASQNEAMVSLSRACIEWAKEKS